MKFSIEKSNRYVESSSLADVVYFIGYRFEDSGSSGVTDVFNYESEDYQLECDSIGSDNFVAFDSLTTSSFESWVMTSHGSNWGTFTSSIATGMTNRLNSRTSANPSEVYTWNSGSLSFDTVSMNDDGRRIEEYRDE
jgi:hypothetical protein